MGRRHDDERMKAARKQFSRNLRAAIEDAGIDQAELARRLGIGPSSVGNWCQGRAIPSVENLILTASIVRQSVSWLVGDALHGFDTLERYERDLAIRLGGQRLRALAQVPDATLLAQVDLLIRSHPSPSETSNEHPKPARLRPARRK